MSEREDSSGASPQKIVNAKRWVYRLVFLYVAAVAALAVLAEVVAFV